MLEATIFSYFTMNNLQDDIAAQQANIVSSVQASPPVIGGDAAH